MQRYLVEEIQSYANAQGFDLVMGEGVFFAKPAARHHRAGAGGADDQAGDAAGAAPAPPAPARHLLRHPQARRHEVTARLRLHRTGVREWP